MFRKLLATLFKRDRWLEDAQARFDEMKRLHSHLFDK